MHGNEFLAGYSAKLVEYGVAVAYLILFVGFWGFIHGGKKAVAAVAAKTPELAKAVTAGWFTVPADVALHPGHTWARMESDGTVAVGLDDLGHRMVGALDGIQLPAAGIKVEQGAAAVTLEAAGKKIGLLSPVDGEVVASNPAAREGEAYGTGWLFKVRPTQVGAQQGAAALRAGGAGLGGGAGPAADDAARPRDGAGAGDARRRRTAPRDGARAGRRALGRRGPRVLPHAGVTQQSQEHRRPS